MVLVTLMVSGPKQQALISAGHPVPPPVQANLLVDTGASCTSIDARFVPLLGLVPTGATKVHTPSTGATPVEQLVFDVALFISGHPGSAPHLIGSLPIIAADFSAQGIDGLLGRDVLRLCRMTYSGPDGLIMLSF